MSGWNDAGFPNPYLVPSVTVAQALYDALRERLEITAEGRKKKEIFSLRRPELLEGNEKERTQQAIFAHYIDYYLLSELLPLYYDKVEFDGVGNWTTEPRYWGYNGLGYYHIFMKRDGLKARGLHENEEFLEWVCEWANGTPDNPYAHPYYENHYYQQFFARWADQRRRFLNLLKYRVLQVEMHRKVYVKKLQLTPAEADAVAYKDLALMALQAPDKIEEDRSRRYGWYISPASIHHDRELIRYDISIILYEPVKIKVYFVEGYNIGERECILKYNATHRQNYLDEYTYNPCNLPFQDGWNEWKFETTTEAVPTGEKMQAVGNDLLFNYDWNSLDIPTPAKDEYGRLKGSVQGFELSSLFFTTDISDTFTYKEPENEN